MCYTTNVAAYSTWSIAYPLHRHLYRIIDVGQDQAENQDTQIKGQEL